MFSSSNAPPKDSAPTFDNRPLEFTRNEEPYGPSLGKQPQQQQQGFDDRGEDDRGSSGRGSRYRLSSEQMRVLRECRFESFWYRCVPFSIGAVLALNLAKQRGLIQAHPRYGMMLKNMAAVGVGYFLGKASYFEKCRDKLRRTPGPLRDLIEGGGHREVLQEMSTFDLPSFRGGSGGGSYQQEGQMQHPSSDMYSNPDFVIPQNELDGKQLNSPAPIPSVSYDELRRRNRDEYRQRQRGGDRQYSQPPPTQRSAESAEAGGAPEEGTFQSQKGEWKPQTNSWRNGYGDTDFQAGRAA